MLHAKLDAIMSANGIYADPYVERILSSDTAIRRALREAAQCVMAGEECPSFVEAAEQPHSDCNGPSWSHSTWYTSEGLHFPQGLSQNNAASIIEFLDEELKSDVEFGFIIPECSHYVCGDSEKVVVNVEVLSVSFDPRKDFMIVNGDTQKHQFLSKFAKAYYASVSA